MVGTMPSIVPILTAVVNANNQRLRDQKTKEKEEQEKKYKKEPEHAHLGERFSIIEYVGIKDGKKRPIRIENVRFKDFYTDDNGKLIFCFKEIDKLREFHRVPKDSIKYGFDLNGNMLYKEYFNINPEREYSDDNLDEEIDYLISLSK